MLTNQEVYDIVCKHLLSMKKRSFNPKLGCMYRDPDGNKCAIGALIPDELYSEDLENQSLITLISRENPAVAHLQDCSITMLDYLQNIHDCSENWSTSTGLNNSGKALLKDVAVLYELVAARI